VRDVLDVLYLVEAEVQTRQVCHVFESLDVRDEVIVEVELRQGRADVRGECDLRYLILSEAYFLLNPVVSRWSSSKIQRRLVLIGWATVVGLRVYIPGLS